MELCSPILTSRRDQVELSSLIRREGEASGEIRQEMLDQCKVFPCSLFCRGPTVQLFRAVPLRVK